MHYLDANKTAGEKARRQLHKNAASNIEQVLEATSHKAPTIWPPTSHHENYPDWNTWYHLPVLKKTLKKQLHKKLDINLQWIQFPKPEA